MSTADIQISYKYGPNLVQAYNPKSLMDLSYIMKHSCITCVDTVDLTSKFEAKRKLNWSQQML